MQNISQKSAVFVLFLIVNLIGFSTRTACQYKLSDPEIYAIQEDCGINPNTNSSGEIELVDIKVFEHIDGTAIEQHNTLDIIEIQPIPALKIQKTPTLNSQSPFPVISKNSITNKQFVIFLNATNIKSNGIMADSTNLSGVRLINDLSKEESLGIKFLDGEWVVSSGFEDGPFLQATWEGASLFAEFVGGRLPIFEELFYLFKIQPQTGFYFNNHTLISNRNLSKKNNKVQFHVVLEGPKSINWN